MLTHCKMNSRLLFQTVNHHFLFILLLTVLQFELATAQDEAEPAFVFPHGYFDSHKLPPFDAIYLNMMANSNLEYGGTNLKNLDKLDAIRKEIKRPENLIRDRVEDGKELDRKTKEELEMEAQESLKKENHTIEGIDLDKLSDADRKAILALLKEEESVKKIVANKEDISPKPKSPFFRRAARDDPIEMDSDNPFEDIATRAPPNSRREFNGLRKRVHGARKHRGHKKDKFLTREDIIKTDPRKHDNFSDEIEFLIPKTKPKKTVGDRMVERTIKEQNTSEAPPLPTLVANASPELMTSTAMPQVEDTTANSPSTPASNLHPILQGIRKLPNNPFGDIDLSQPTIVRLPIPSPIDFS